MEEKIVV